MPEAALELQEVYERRARRLVFVLLGAGALMLLVALAAAVQSVVSVNRDTAAVEHTLEVRTAIAELSTQAERIETARRGFLIEPGPGFQAIVTAAAQRFDAIHRQLSAKVADNPAQSRRMAEVRRLADEKKAILAAMLANPEQAVARISNVDFDADRGVRITRRIRAILQDMAAEEERLQAARAERQYASRNQFYLVGGAASLLLVLMLTGALAIVMRYNRELGRAQARLREVNEGLEDAVAARTTELSRANAEIQRFAYIVSHDLRSPLVNVLGFTAELDAARKTLHSYLSRLYEAHPELRDQAAWLAVEEDLPEALDFIRTSTEKMDRLINSILELSRQGRRTLRPETLDMTALAEEVAGNLRQRAEAAGATVTIAPLPPLESDRMAVEQILSNLVENAIKYLSPKRRGEVRIEGRRKAGWVEIDVIDNGRGIAPEDHERIFDLFRRAGAQDQAGEGIGLANVRALAYRLGGRVGVESQLDEGARFTLALPEKYTAVESRG